jgi:hypothetical protein
MTNKEQIRKDIVIAFDFAEQILDNPNLLDKIPEGTSIVFLDEENKNIEKPANELLKNKYVKVKRHFEVL